MDKNRMSSVWIKLYTVCVMEHTYVARILDDCHLHSKAESQIWDIVFPGILSCCNHALNTTVSKASRNDNSLNPLEYLCCIVIIKLL